MEKKNRFLSVKSIVLYASGIMGLQLMIGLLNGYQSQFYTSMFGADLMIVAAIILAAKLISSLADPLFGRLIDKSRFKSGKMKPFIAMTALPFAILTTLMFVYVPFGNKAAMYIYITFTSVVWNIVMSLADISSQGMLALLSPNAEERNSAAGITNTLKSIGLSANGVLVPIVCLITGSQDIGKMEYLISAAVLSILGGGLFLFILFTKETVPTSPAPMSLKDMGRELKNNKMLLIVFLIFMLGFGRNMQMGIGVQAAAVFFPDGLTIPILGHLDGENLPWLLGLTSAVSSLTSIICAPFLNKRWGEKKTAMIFGIYGFITMTLAFVLYATGIFVLRSVWSILIYQFLTGLSMGAVGYLPMVMVSDIVDYQEWKTGKRTEGIQFAVLSLSNKISNALSVAVGIFVCGASGYNAAAIREGTLSISSSMQTVVSVAYFLLPGICMLLSCVPMIFYKINKKVKDEMRRDLSIKWGVEDAVLENAAGGETSVVSNGEAIADNNESDAGNSDN